jgi:hypothetical protein
MFKIMQLNVATREYRRVFDVFASYEAAHDFFQNKIVKVNCGDTSTTYVGDDMSVNGNFVYRIVECK